MCGIAGILGDNIRVPGRQILPRMLERLSHRGPDDRGEFFDSEENVALGHTRLAILDLSPGGHQPMMSKSGRHAIVFNGEIYNYRELRSELERSGHVFSSHSDTEVILSMFTLFGEKCLSRLQGMFAFAIWDTVDKSLFLARDPLGIKPLYLWNVNSQLAFASEMRGIFEADLGPKNLDLDAAFLYFQLGTVPEPKTLVDGIQMLCAGHYVTWKDGCLSTPQQYWDFQFRGQITDSEISAEVTRSALMESVERHFVSDVPVGLFLSGGLDSTAILALANQIGHRNLQTFCISFDSSEYNEGHLAKKTASHFGTQHTDWRMSSEDGKQLTAGFLDAMDRPTNDGFNTYCVSHLASQSGIKVVLSGVGGDELFGGYPSFQRIPSLLKTKARLQRIRLTSAARGLIGLLGRQPKWSRLQQFLDSAGSVSDAWLAMRGFFTSAESRALVARLGGSIEELSSTSWMQDLNSGLRDPATEAIPDQISRLELSRYMRNQLLRDSDVMSMHWGLELRVPFVDATLLERVSRISSELRLAPGKQLLKSSVPEIPDWIINQPKRGFRFPFEQWATECWGEWFEQMEAGSPVLCQTWYRKWTLIAMQHFLDLNSISYPGERLDRVAA
jgi:asparagine synthase (glutamine-hydrolysing)